MDRIAVVKGSRVVEGVMSAGGIYGDLVGLVGRTLKITQERSIFTLLEMARP